MECQVDFTDDLDENLFAHVAPDADQTKDSQGFTEYSFSSAVGAPYEERELAPISHSTSRKPKSTTVYTRPAVPKAPRLPCTQCVKTFANERTLAVHVKMHNMAILSKRIPTDQQMSEITQVALSKSLQEIEEEAHRDDLAECLCIFCSCVQKSIADGKGEDIIECYCRHFMSILKGLNVLLPSALRCTVLASTNKFLCSPQFISELEKILSVVSNAGIEVLNSFIGHVSLKVFDWQFLMCLRIIRGQSINDDSPLRQRFSSDASHQEYFQQVVYHIGGSILKGVLSKAKQYPCNANWAEYKKVITGKFLLKSQSESDDCLAHVKCFTQGRDLGGLKYLNSNAFDLFLALFDTIQCLEGSDGSLPLDVVEDKVYSHDIIMFMWDELIGAELSEEQSIHLFSDIVRCCTKVSAKGMLKRRLNEFLTKAYSSVPLRSVLSRS